MNENEKPMTGKSPNIRAIVMSDDLAPFVKRIELINCAALTKDSVVTLEVKKRACYADSYLWVDSRLIEIKELREEYKRRTKGPAGNRWGDIYRAFLAAMWFCGNHLPGYKEDGEFNFTLDLRLPDVTV
jgi:hypothetical protein